MYQPDDLFFQRYRLVEQLGMGGFSQVWRTRDEKAGVEVAVKIFNRQDPTGIALCRQEYQQAHHLVHPNILRPLFFDDHEGAPFLVLPYCRRGSIASLIGTISQAETARLVAQIGSALQYLHGRSIPLVHSDIKPDNILIDDEGNYLLSDFGISRYMQVQLTRTMTAVHPDVGDTGATPIAYRAPELFAFRDQMQQTPEPATDVWAFGATLYQLTTGTLPFNGQGGFTQYLGMVTHQAVLEDLLAPLPAIYNKNIQSLIFKCLALKPEQRPEAGVLILEPDLLSKPAIDIPVPRVPVTPSPKSPSPNISPKRPILAPPETGSQVGSNQKRFIWWGAAVVLVLVVVAGSIVVASGAYRQMVKEADQLSAKGDYANADNLYRQALGSIFANEEEVQQKKEKNRQLQKLAGYEIIRESSEGIAAAAKKREGSLNWGFIDPLTGEVLIPVTYDSVGDFRDGLCQVWRFGKSTTLNRDGILQIPDRMDTSEDTATSAVVMEPVVDSEPLPPAIQTTAPAREVIGNYSASVGARAAMQDRCGGSAVWLSERQTMTLKPKVAIKLARAAVISNKPGRVRITISEKGRELGSISNYILEGKTSLELGPLTGTLKSGSQYTLVITTQSESGEPPRLQNLAPCGAASGDKRLGLQYNNSIVLLDLQYQYD